MVGNFSEEREPRKQGSQTRGPPDVFLKPHRNSLNSVHHFEMTACSTFLQHHKTSCAFCNSVGNSFKQYFCYEVKISLLSTFRVLWLSLKYALFRKTNTIVILISGLSTHTLEKYVIEINWLRGEISRAILYQAFVKEK